MRPRKRAVSRFVTNRLVNPIVRPFLEGGLWPRSQALLETTGRKTGLQRRVRERLRWLRRPVNDSLLLLVGTQQLTIRLDLERHA